MTSLFLKRRSSTAFRHAWRTRTMAGFLLLPGCSTVDHFGARSARFNAATVEGRSQAIFSNIMRAASARPPATGHTAESDFNPLGHPSTIHVARKLL
ncbi:hypothetical protein [Sphingomonas sp. CFBP 13733]|uniref:hypothetical protein n=1 Tax=Sphingomonas sp. CFBP 13733 TaxID=2775291 RepID=UPI00178503E9|nr:hypothetical protein [Sphingomonas sp. CFBP 13733]MBD8637862.1 hypothetical protein [Sphingomonas sp. CFBP 13733]